jgi:DNA-binding transcriptional LysR family regulator
LIRNAETDLVVASECLRRSLSALIAVDACSVHVERARNVTNLVSLGLGVSIVPHRVLALQPKSRPVQRIITDPKFSRELVVVVRRQPEIPTPLKEFVANILF